MAHHETSLASREVMAPYSSHGGTTNQLDVFQQLAPISALLVSFRATDLQGLSE